MNTEQQRADFEAWFTKTKAYISDPKDIFAQIVRDIAWDAWQAGRAALQSQVNNEAADRVREFLDKWLQIRLNDKAVIYRLNDLELRVDDLRALLALQSQDREDAERLEWLVENMGRVDIDEGHRGWFVLERDTTNYLVEDCKTFREAIDHARRIEGDDHE